MLTTSPTQIGSLALSPHQIGSLTPDGATVGAWYDGIPGVEQVGDAVSAGIDFVSEVGSAIANITQGDFDGAWEDVKDAGAASLRPTLAVLKDGLKHVSKDAYKIVSDPVNVLAIAGALAACAGTGGAACGPALLVAVKVVAAREVARVSKKAWDDLSTEGRRQLVKGVQKAAGKAFQLATDNLSREAGKSERVKAEAAKLARQRRDAAVSAQEMIARLRTADVWLRAQGVRS